MLNCVTVTVQPSHTKLSYKVLKNDQNYPASCDFCNQSVITLEFNKKSYSCSANLIKLESQL